MNPPRTATPFELQNQFGQPVSLEDHAGKVVLLNFLYTNCPNVCPMVTNQLRDLHGALGDDTDDVAFVAVSVDPKRDTVQAAFEYSEKWEMTHRWDYLVGDEQELTPIWDAYHVASIPLEPEEVGSSIGTAVAGQQDGVKGLKKAIMDRYRVIHTTPVYLIDGEGDIRGVFTPPFEPNDVSHDIRVLVN